MATILKIDSIKICLRFSGGPCGTPGLRIDIRMSCRNFVSHFLFYHFSVHISYFPLYYFWAIFDHIVPAPVLAIYELLLFFSLSTLPLFACLIYNVVNKIICKPYLGSLVIPNLNYLVQALL